MTHQFTIFSCVCTGSKLTETFTALAFPPDSSKCSNSLTNHRNLTVVTVTHIATLHSLFFILNTSLASMFIHFTYSLLQRYNDIAEAALSLHRVTNHVFFLYFL